MPKETQKYKAQRSKITATLADKLKAHLVENRPIRLDGILKSPFRQPGRKL